jgi:hypothetical protein
LKIKLFLLLAVALSAVFLGSSTAGATALNGFKPKVLAMGTLAKPAEVDALGIHFATEAPTDVYVQQGDFPGNNPTTGISSTGWHEHPGLVVVTVNKGSVIFHNGCRTATYVAGQSFVEPALKPVMVENALTTDSQVHTILIVPKGRATRIDIPAPVCGGTEDQESD